MQARQFSELIKNPGALEKSHLSELQQLLGDFPYFQSAHILLAMAAKRWDAGVYEKHLKQTAISVSNRSHLFHLLHAQEAMAQAAVVPEITVPLQAQALPEEKAEIRAEEIKQELDILKATEVVHEEAEAKQAISAVHIEPVLLEEEIAKQVVASIVDKEIINADRKPPETPLRKESDDFKPASFTDWLAYIKKNNGEPYVQIEKKVIEAKEQKQQLKTEEIANVQMPESPKVDKKQKNKALIDKIIESNPGSIKIKEEQKFFQPDTKAKESLLENEHLVTETLAKIYALQGNTAKAIRAYQILSLKFPQKSVYFATLIQKLKNND